MAKVGQIYYNVIDNNAGSYISSGQDIFSDMVSGYSANYFTKIGVQAPPGTKVVLNKAKTIMVGRTGLYELDDDIEVTNMYFSRPRQYIKDQTASDEMIEQGSEQMLQANADREVALANFYQVYPEMPDKDTDPTAYAAYWEAYNTIQANYITAYQQGLNLFNQGSNGVYTLPNPLNPDAPENFKDLYNVIVDFIYE